MSRGIRRTARGSATATLTNSVGRDAGRARLASTYVVALLVVVAAAAIWIRVFDRLRAAEPVPVRGTPTAIVWSDRVFRTEAELAAWFRDRGIVYRRWARAHPAAVKILRSRERAPRPRSDASS